MKSLGCRGRLGFWFFCWLGLVTGLAGNLARAQTNAELSLSLSDAPVAASAGQFFRFSISIFNNGPDGPTNVVIRDMVPTNAVFIGASATQGTVTYSNGVVSCNAGRLPFYRSAGMTIELKATTAGSISNLATVTSELADSVPTNNLASFIATVTTARFFGVGAVHSLYNSPSMTLMGNNQVLIVGQHLGKVSDLYDFHNRSFATPTGTMAGYHEGGSATVLNSGLVLLAGGANGTSAKTAELYDPTTQNFQQVGDMLVYAPGNYSTLQADGTVVLCGGGMATNELFNPVSGTFSLAPTKQCAFNGLYLPTGKYLYFGYGRAYLYDTNTSASVETSGFLQPRAYQSATLLPGGKVLLAGGQGTWGATYNSLASAELYDPATDSFSWTANLTTTRENHSACLLPDGTVLLAGGMISQNDPFSLTNAEIYDPTGTVPVPGVGASDSSMAEGASGTNFMPFNVWLTATSALPVTVQYAVTAGTASSVSYGVGTPDFIPVTGTVTFPPGSTNQVVQVPILGDQILEPNETLFLNLSKPTQAWMSRAVATGTILNDDTAPTISTSPASVIEGDSGLSNLLFSVSLSAPCLTPVMVDYYTVDGTAQAGSDYVATSGTLTFNPGDTNLMIGVPVIGDLAVEPDETLTLILTNAQNGALVVSKATGTILNDDGIAGRIHHFDWAGIPSPQEQTVPFPVTITARDSSGGVVSNLPWPVRISGMTTNFIATNLDFEQPSLSPWTTFNYTPYPRTFQQALYDVAGLGQPSTCLRTPSGGGTNGVTQNIFLTGGIPYTFKVNAAEALEANDSSCLGATLYLIVADTNAAWGASGTCYGVGRGTITMTYVPPTNGIYPLTLLINRDWWYGDALYVYIDDVQISYPLVTPSSVTNFTNGVWAGSVAALQPGGNVWLQADDGAGHKGASNPFDVLSATDVGISGSSQIIGAPPVRTGMQMAFNLAVTNRGPATASNVVVQSTLPANFSFVSATNSSGALSNVSGVVLWTIASLSKGSNATARLVLQASLPGQVTNVFSVSNSFIDLNLADNVLAISNQISPPLLSIAPASGLEGPASSTGLVFNITLSGASGQAVSIDYFTSDGTGTNGVDYTGTNGTVTLPPGSTNAALKVFPLDNILNQPNRNFTVTLTNPVNTILSVTNVTGTIIDDDPPPIVWIYNTSLVEGDSGTTNAVFQLTLSKPAIYNVVVTYRTQDGTASSTNDYVAQNSSVTFVAGTTNASIQVAVNGDTVNEPDENFLVILTSASNATLGTNTANGTILNDDAVAGRLDHFIFNPVPAQEFNGRSFPITVKAVDYLGATVTNFAGSAVLTAQTDQYYSNYFSANFEDGLLTGWSNTSSPTLIATNAADFAQAGQHSLRLTGKAAQSFYTFSLRHGFSNNLASGVSFYVRAAQTNALCGRLTAVGSSGYAAFDFNMGRDGRMGLQSGQTFYGQPYVSNKWYRVDVQLDWTRHVTSLMLDGVGVATNVPFLISGPYLDTIAVQNTDNGTSWFDGINVFRQYYTNLFVTPSNLATFNGGVWTGAVTIPNLGTNAYFTVTDNNQHVGRSTNFDLLPVDLRFALPAAVTEGAGSVTGMVSIPFSLAQASTIYLTSSLPSRLTVPPSVIIPAGLTNANFALTVIDDSILNGPQIATISGGASNLVSGSGTIEVDDNESAILSLTLPATAAENVGTLINAGRL